MQDSSLIRTQLKSRLGWLISPVLLNQDLSLFESTVDPDQLASDKAMWSGPTLLSTLIEKKNMFTMGESFQD